MARVGSAKMDKTGMARLSWVESCWNRFVRLGLAGLLGMGHGSHGSGWFRLGSAALGWITD